MHRSCALLRRSTVSLLMGLVALPGAFAQQPVASPPAAPPAGFTALFNGQDLTGWKGLVSPDKGPPARMKMSADELAKAQEAADKKMRDHWSAKDGVLVFDGKGDSICTAKDYGDFEMLVDWKIGPEGDSGVYLRGSPQVQIWDIAKHPEGSGGLYNNEKNPKNPLKAADKPVGEWNTFRIKMIGERVTVHLNDVLVVDNTVLENYWERAKPIYPTGQIELQNHGNPLYFRNVFIREVSKDEKDAAGEKPTRAKITEELNGPNGPGGPRLGPNPHPDPNQDKPADPTKPDQKPDAKKPAADKDGWITLFNGKDTTGWQCQPGGWVVEDGALARKGGGDIWTKEQYGDFVLDVEFKLDKETNSGIFIRTADLKDMVQTGIEIQVLDSFGKAKADKHDCGAVYDCLEPSKNTVKKPGEWNHCIVTCKGSKIMVELNGEKIIDMDLDKWTTAHKNPDGTENKFNTAYKDMPRKGYIGFQDHGKPVWYRNVKIKKL